MTYPTAVPTTTPLQDLEFYYKQIKNICPDFLKNSSLQGEPLMTLKVNVNWFIRTRNSDELKTKSDYFLDFMNPGDTEKIQMLDKLLN